MTRLTYPLPLIVVGFALAGCPGETSSDGGETETEGNGTTAGDGMDDNTSGPMTNDDTAGPDTSADDPDTSADDPSSGPDPCDGVVCEADEECVGGICVPIATTGEECETFGEGVWADCIDDGVAACMSPAASCIPNGTPGEASCIFTPGDPTAGCQDRCDCPADATSGTAVVTCDDVVGPMGMDDGINECYLDCSGGEACPDGQFCFSGFVCMHTNTPQPSPVGPYEGCVTPLFPCETGSVCIQGPGGTDTSCAQDDCDTVADCPAAPTGGTAECANITGPDDPDNECHLSCDGVGEMCPDGWECFLDFVCLQPVPQPGSQACDPYGICGPAETCYEDAGYSICSEPDCTTAADCAFAIGAPLACGDIGAGADQCYLDCSGGGTCPGGTECVNDTYCAYPIPAASCTDNIADPGFEGGTPNTDWTEASTAFGTPLCDPVSCGGDGAHSGAWWVFFGGVSGAVEDGSMEQDVTINAGAVLNFYLSIDQATNTNPELDTFAVLVDATEVFAVTAEDAASYDGYTLVTVDLTGFDDDGSHTLRLESQTQGDAVTSFFVDSLYLDCSGGGSSSTG